MTTTIDFRQHLARQLGFLERSCRSYDEGHTDESIRIATVIRVLIHDTKNCVSLLSHLNATNIKFISTVPTIIESRTALFHGMGQFIFSSLGFARRPFLDDDFPTKKLVSTNEWWNQTVYINGSLKLNRKIIVLGAADKDGGAHVDAKLSSEYAALAESGSMGSLIYDNHSFHVTIPIENAHLVYIRQMGHEILKSSELRQLVTSP